MLSYNELKPGTRIILDGQPIEIIEASLLFKGRGHSVLQAKLKNLINGNVISKTFHPADAFKEADIQKFKAKFLYSYRNKYVFVRPDIPSPWFELTDEQIGPVSRFLKPEQEVEALDFNGKIINVSLPIKVSLMVKEAPPGVKGDRSNIGTKQVILETGATIDAPLFIEEGDIIEVNTETGEYVRRISG